jgi:adenine-specific DNA-methyltransferase
LLPRTEKQNERYNNPDNDPRGPWTSDNLSVKTYSKEYDYSIKTPNGRLVNPPAGRCWLMSKKGMMDLIRDNRVWFGPNNNNAPRLKRFLSEVKQGLVPITLWLREDVGDTQEAVREFNKLLPGAKFDNPKPVKLLQLIQSLTTSKDNDDIILDFFAGSGTTAHSILQQNYLDEGNRRFLLVQLPQIISKEDNNFNKEFNTISDISKERIRRVIKQIKEESKQHKLTNTSQDLGFKVFKLTKSNYKQWKSPEDESKLKSQLKLFENPLIENYKELDVIYEIIIKEGYSLNSKIANLDIKSNTIYKVSDQEYFFFVCLDKQVMQSSLEALKLNPTIMFACLDSALDDSQKSNLSKICKLRTI